MRKNDDFQLEERVEQNIKRKKNFLRWAAFGINLVCFLLYILFLIVDVSEVFYRGSPFINVYHSMPHVLWIPLLIWMGMLIIHLGSVLIESETFNTLLAQRAAYEERQIIDTILKRLATAEKRKRDSSRMEDDLVMISDENVMISRMEIEEQPRHAML